MPAINVIIAVNGMALREMLTRAGNKCDGHVTNGSVAEQIEQLYEFFLQRGIRLNLDGLM